MEIDELPADKKIILFDGICNLCNKSVQYIIRKDQKNQFRFVALQSELGQKIIKHIGISAQKIDSIVLYQPGIAYYYKSSAIIEIFKTLQGFINYGIILQLLPTSIADKIYDMVAKNRYQWMGKKESCLIPSQEIKSKFLS